ncbi:MAG: hypothetical protein D3914_13060, partial [Candidatus Electrothrix sp. LOE2]|nr:hypothetical protein [Candidatus Electrothrix sp. LOE2]
WLVLEEMAMSLDDVIFRRTGAGTIGRPDETALERVAAIMAGELGWTEQRKEKEKQQVLAHYSYNSSEEGGKE